MSFNPMSSVRVQCGAPIIRRLFMDDGAEQSGVVLCGWKNGVDNFVVWWCDRDGVCYGGRYVRLWALATEAFRERCMELANRSNPKLPLTGCCNGVILSEPEDEDVKSCSGCCKRVDDLGTPVAA